MQRGWWCDGRRRDLVEKPINGDSLVFEIVLDIHQRMFFPGGMRVTRAESNKRGGGSQTGEGGDVTRDDLLAP